MFPVTYTSDLTNMNTFPFKIPESSAVSRIKKEYFDITDLLPEDENLPKFWVEQETANGKKRLGVEQKLFIEFLEHFGFRKVVLDNEVTYVRVNLNILYEVTIPQMKDFLLKFFDGVCGEIDAQEIIVCGEFTLEALVRYCYLNAGSLFNKEKIEMIKSFEGEMYIPGKHDNAFFFTDGWVKITPESMTKHSYVELPPNMAIWSKSVIAFNIMPWPISTDCQFQEFIRLITGKKNGHTAETQEAKKRQIEQAIGYLMHPFFEGALRAILLTDVNSSGQKANGRTGKGLIATAISKIFPTTIIPAKRWKQDSPVNFGLATKDTKLIVLDDLAEGFKSEWVFNNITEGTIVKKMHKNEFMIQTKLLLLTNKMIKGEGSSTRGRFLEFEIENFFNHLYKPIDHFGCNFFSKHDWNEKEYAAFYWYLMSCSYQNLQKSKEGYDCGVEYVQSASIEQKRLAQNLEEDFIAYMDSLCKEWFNKPGGGTFEIKELKTNYLEDQNDKFRKFSSKLMKEWILEYCDFKGYSLEEASRGNNRIKYRISPQKAAM